MKRTASFLITILLFGCIPLLLSNHICRIAKSSPNFPTDMPFVFIDPLNVTANPGEAFTIAMKIFNLSNNHHLASEQWAPGEPLPPADSRFNYSLGNLYGLDFTFSWDPTLLDYESHTVKVPVEDYPDGVLHRPIFDLMDMVNHVDGTYWLAKSSTLPAEVFNAPDANVTVFEMTFRVKKIGKGVFNITTSDLANPVFLPGHADAYFAVPHHVRHGRFQSELAAVRVKTLDVGVEVGNISFDPPLISGEDAVVKAKLINEADALDTFNLTLSLGATILETWTNEVLEGGESRIYDAMIEASSFTLGDNTVMAKVNSTILMSYNLTEELSTEFLVLGTPDIDIDGPSSAKAGETVEFSALGGHTDPSGEILNYTWKIFAPGEGTPIQTRHGEDVAFTFDIRWIGGNWTVALSVKDNFGMTYDLKRPATSAWCKTKILEVTDFAISVYIRADGSVDPPAAPISTMDNNTYTLTDNINGWIVVERDNIVVDGGGYTLQGTGSGRGINITERNNVTIINIMVKSFDYGIWSHFSWNCNIIGNTVLENNWAGITIYYSQGCRLSGNNVTENNDGIWVPHSTRNILSNNTVTDNNYYGFYIDHDSYHNDIHNNTIEDNYYGIYLAPFSHNNTFVGNNITNNGVGVYINHSPDNLFFHNNFTNGIQVVNYENHSTNRWDGGQPPEGNYWSDYNERYPDATELDGSGIWNTPYIIDENNQDNYPLIPEYSSLIIPPLFMLATLIAALVHKRKRAKSERAGPRDARARKS